MKMGFVSDSLSIKLIYLIACVTGLGSFQDRQSHGDIVSHFLNKASVWQTLKQQARYFCKMKHICFS